MPWYAYFAVLEGRLRAERERVKELESQIIGMKKMINSILTFGLTTIEIISIVLMSGCVNEKEETPTITPATQGYIQGYDHKLGYGFDYPADWEMQIPEFDSPYENVEVFTKIGEPTRIKVSVKSTDLKSLAEVKAFGYI